MGFFDKLLGGGSEGNLSKAIESQYRPKPGIACFASCWIDDERCQACLAEQAPIAKGIEELRRIEKAIDDPEILNTKGFEKCTLCGAPYESGWTECSYCGTPYPENVLAVAGLPNSAAELRQLAINKAMEVWGLYIPVYKKHLDRLGSGASIFLKMSYSLVGSLTKQTMSMSAQQLQQGANKHGVSLSDYICGVMNGSIEAESVTKFNETTAQLAEQQRQINERQRQRDDAMLAQRYRSNEYQQQLQLNMINSRTPKYGGGASFQRTCADCTYYSAGARKCGHSGFSTNAGDSCGYFRIK